MLRKGVKDLHLHSLRCCTIVDGRTHVSCILLLGTRHDVVNPEQEDGSLHGLSEIFPRIKRSERLTRV